MRLDRIQVELRPRSPWEAMELGLAMVRRYARTIWLAWFALSLPLFAILNAAAWMLDALPWAGIAMWWLKPLFDRLPLFVLSRAVFGGAPTVRETLSAPRVFGWGGLLRDLTWGRPSLTRSVAMPVTLLEGAKGEQLRERRKAIVGARGSGAAMGLTFLCMTFEGILALSCVTAVFLFVPMEYLSESALAVWSLLFESPPKWAWLAWNAIVWSAMSFVEPFYMGAGFAFYLNRRTHLEAWDLELAFRRLATRLRAAVPLGVALCIGLAAGAWMPAHATPSEAPITAERAAAAAAAAAAKAPRRPLEQAIDGPAFVEDARFAGAVGDAYRDPLLNPKRKQSFWELRWKPDAKRSANPGSGVGEVFALLFKAAMWLAAIGAAVLILWQIKRWWGPMWQGGKAVPEPSPIAEAAVPMPETLPADVASAARKLWMQGQARAALALLYRGSVQKMVERANAALAPGATEAECLRASRRMPSAEDREAFAQVVRVWQHAAYAQRLPDNDAFESLLQRAASRFGWAA
ncbi:DUF4129 domain-containing protein [Luteimonas gilva]|uniref:DUF4129 domain-containing protein n=1 Tax=Luteimonas gilva TaxID=2572684 RepID=A0A4U5JL41_9GAMM|nr:DUF4129 domain-containing protein [Luteimonas gilva]TKR30340.1 DUF4129 domain-containing protein [Luteimonas gilva]